jgi:hypothetical protein
MADAAEREQEPRWLIGPPDPNEILLYIAAGDDVPADQAIRQALDRLLAALQAQEVEGYARCFPRCGDLNSCSDFSCSPLHNCTQLLRIPCVARMECKISRIA